MSTNVKRYKSVAELFTYIIYLKDEPTSLSKKEVYILELNKLYHAKLGIHYVTSVRTK